MTRAEEERLVRFCAAQYRSFCAKDWRADDERSRAQLATVAYFLGTTYGYGHEPELLAVSERLHPGVTSDFEVFRALCVQTGFEPSSFHDMLQAELSDTGTRF